MSGDQAPATHLGDRSWAARLIRRRAGDRQGDATGQTDSLHGWVLNLPWVVERPTVRRARGVRLFAVDCEPLGRRRMWLTTGPVHDDDVRHGVAVSVVLPVELSPLAQSLGWGVVTGQLPAGHVLLSAQPPHHPGATERLEAMLLAAYSYALS
jgi:hypothetical protein